MLTGEEEDEGEEEAGRMKEEVEKQSDFNFASGFFKTIKNYKTKN